MDKTPRHGRTIEGLEQLALMLARPNRQILGNDPVPGSRNPAAMLPNQFRV
jgi:hypothetical protein